MGDAKGGVSSAVLPRGGDAVETAEKSGLARRWLRVPIWVIMVSSVAFTRVYLRARRPWLAATKPEELDAKQRADEHRLGAWWKTVTERKLK